MKLIYETSDYSIFRKLKGNRDVTSKRSNEIRKSIEGVGWISNPIVVNENMEIIDGQGRLEALKQLGMPVEYVIHEGAGLKECQEMNIHGENWSSLEMIKSLAMTGHDGCRKFYQLMVEFDLPMTYIANVLRLNRNSKKYMQSIHISDAEYEEARYVLTEMKKYLSVMREKKIKGRVDSISYAIAYCIRHGVNTEEMVSALQRADKDSVICTSVELAIKSMQDAYNYNKKAKRNRIYVYESYRKGE